jgi:hypothetical protein
MTEVRRGPDMTEWYQLRLLLERELGIFLLMNLLGDVSAVTTTTSPC